MSSTQTLAVRTWLGSGYHQSLTLSISKNAYLMMRQIALHSLHSKSYNGRLQESKPLDRGFLLCNGSRLQPFCLLVIHSICENRNPKAYEIFT